MNAPEAEAQGSGEMPGDAPEAGGSTPPPQRRVKTAEGMVYSDKMQKTRTVRLLRLVEHPKYGKYQRRRSTFYAHDEQEISHEGDTVLIAETRPISKNKRWRVVKVLAKAAGRHDESAASEKELATPQDQESAAPEGQGGIPQGEGGAST